MVRQSKILGVAVIAASLAGCSAEGVSTPARELSEADFRAACVEEIGTEILSPATMEVVDWEFQKLPITEEMMAGVREQLEAGSEPANPAEMAQRILVRDRLNRYDRAVTAGVEPITYKALLSFDSLNAAGVPIRADASCLHHYFGPEDEPFVSAELYPR